MPKLDSQQVNCDDDFNERFKMFYLQNTTHYENFKSRQYQATINVQEKTLNYQQKDVNSMQSSKYYIVEVLDILPLRNINDPNQTLSSPTRSPTKWTFKNDIFTNKFMPLETNLGSEVKPSSTSQKTQTNNVSTLLPQSQIQQNSTHIPQNPPTQTKEGIQKDKNHEDFSKSSFELEYPAHGMLKDIYEDTHLATSPRYSQTLLTPRSQDDNALINKMFQIDQQDLLHSYDNPAEPPTTTTTQEFTNPKHNRKIIFNSMKAEQTKENQQCESTENIQQIIESQQTQFANLHSQMPLSSLQSQEQELVTAIIERQNIISNEYPIKETGTQPSKNNGTVSQINSEIKSKTKKSIGSISFFQKISTVQAENKVNSPPESLSSSLLPSQDEKSSPLKKQNTKHLRQASIESQHINPMFKDNEMIQTIVQTKHPKILNPLNYLISNRIRLK